MKSDSWSVRLIKHKRTKTQIRNDREDNTTDTIYFKIKEYYEQFMPFG